MRAGSLVQAAQNHGAGPLPVVVAVQAALDHRGRPGVEHLVLEVPARELRADRVPYQLQQPNSMLGVHVGPAHEPLEVGLGHRVVPGAHRRRHLDRGPAGQLPQSEVDVAVQRRLQRHRRVQHLRVGPGYAVAVDGGVVLPGQHQPVGHRRLGGHPGQAELEVAVGGLARPLGQLRRQPGQEPELHRVADLGLGVAQHVGRGAGELGEGDLRVAVHEHVLGGHVHIVEDDQRVDLVVNRGQRVVAGRGDVAAVGPARVDAQPGVVHGDHHRQAVVVGTWR